MCHDHSANQGVVLHLSVVIEVCFAWDTRIVSSL